MATPPTFVGTATTITNNTSNKTLSRTPGAIGNLLLVLEGAGDNNDRPLAPTATGYTITDATGLNAVVAKVNTGTTAQASCNVFTETAKATSSTSFTFTNQGANEFGGVLVEYSGTGGIGNCAVGNNGTSSGTPSTSITTSGDNSDLLVVSVDWNAGATSPNTWSTINGNAPTALMAVLVSGGYTIFIERFADVGLAGAKTVAQSAPTGQRYVTAIVEVLAAVSASVTGLASAAGVAWAGTTAQVSIDVVGTGRVGSLAWSGATATLLVGVMGIAHPGAVVWAGTAATVTAGAASLAHPGALAWSGTAATLNADLILGASAGSLSWAGTTAQVTIGSGSNYNGFGSSDPGVTFGGDSNEGVFSTCFSTTLSGQSAVGARFYIPAAATGDPTACFGYLYATDSGTGYPTGAALAVSALTNLTIGAWNDLTFTSAFALTANTPYYVAVYNKGNLYGFISHEFDSDLPAPDGASGLTFLAGGSTHENGAYVYSGPGGVPASSFGNTWYGVDAILSGGSSSDVTATASPAALAWAGTTAQVVSTQIAAGHPGAVSIAGTTGHALIGIVVAARAGGYALGGTAPTLDSTTTVALGGPWGIAFAGTNASLIASSLSTAHPAGLAWAGTTAQVTASAGTDVTSLAHPAGVTFGGTTAQVTIAAGNDVIAAAHPAGNAWAGTTASVISTSVVVAHSAGIIWAATTGQLQAGQLALSRPAGVGWAGTTGLVAVGQTGIAHPGAATWGGTTATVNAASVVTSPAHSAGIGWAGTTAAVSAAAVPGAATGQFFAFF